ncbi:MAG TPA: hypothetical protein VKP65_17080 [Rhodothermales bacterium]|nr:hypothetical protein [Rhodothermales bacterium]
MLTLLDIPHQPIDLMRFGLACAFALLFGSGCTIVEPDVDLPAGATAIQTNQTQYKAQQISGDRAGIQVTIPMTFRNITQETAYFVGCRRPPMPILQKRVGNTWVFAWGGIELLCLSDPWPIAPGATFQDTLRLRGYQPSAS